MAYIVGVVACCRGVSGRGSVSNFCPRHIPHSLSRLCHQRLRRPACRWSSGSHQREAPGNRHSHRARSVNVVCRTNAVGICSGAIYQHANNRTLPRCRRACLQLSFYEALHPFTTASAGGCFFLGNSYGFCSPSLTPSPRHSGWCTLETCCGPWPTIRHTPW